MSAAAERRLAAILHADVVGYSRLMAQDEDATVGLVTTYREEVELLVHQHRGELVDFTGDNFLAEFGSAVAAVACATEIQRVLNARNAPLPDDRKMQFRMGIHLGEVRVEGERRFGTGVNVAARIQALAEPGGICISGEVHRLVKGKLDFSFKDLDEQAVKNIPEPVHVYSIDTEQQRALRQARGNGSKLLYALAASVVGILVLVWYFAQQTSETPQPAVGVSEERALALSAQQGRASIAVLPFVDMSPEGDQRYLGDGIAEELLNSLYRLPNLHVASRTDAFRFRERDESIAAIGRALGVGVVLEGSVRRSGERLRIAAQLIDVETGFHLWSEIFEERMGDIFDIETRISQSVADALSTHLGLEPGGDATVDTGTRSVEAYTAYLRGRERQALDTPSDLQAALVHYESAVELDPDFLLAHFNLVGAALRAQLWGVQSDARRLARRLRERIEQADPASLGDHAWRYQLAIRTSDWDWRGAEQLIREYILGGHPHVESPPPMEGSLVGAYAGLLWVAGLYEEFLRFNEYEEKAGRGVGFLATLAYAGLGDLEESIQRTQSAQGPLPWLSALGALRLAELGRFKQAEVWLAQIPEELGAYPVTYRCLVLIKKGETLEARALLDELHSRSDAIPFYLGMAHHMLGELDEGFRWWRTSYEAHDTLWTFHKHLVQHIPEATRQDPRYLELLERIGLTDAWGDELRNSAKEVASAVGIPAPDAASFGPPRP